jgi:hypothetical protein
MKLSFGSETKLIDLAPTNYYSEDEPLWIKGRITTQYFIGGIYVRNEGYVLSPKATTDYYIPFPKAGELAALQKVGAMPAVIPEFKIPPIELVNGYMVWIAFGLSTAWYIIKSKIESRLKLISDDPNSVVTRLDQPEAQESIAEKS